MRLDDRTIAAAFREHFLRYVTGKRGWDVSYHVRLWHQANRAFSNESPTEFDEVYGELRRVWQAFRGSGTSWSPEATFAKLLQCDQKCRGLRLLDLKESDWPVVWSVLQRMEGLKVNKTGPSIVAISKVLHFWNPSLFVIVDVGVVWNWVLRHQWIRREIQDVRKDTDQRLFGRVPDHSDETCDLATYLAILVWASQLLCRNPGISSRFGAYVREKSDSDPPSDVGEYDAAAVEWFLLGLVEIPPSGVEL